MGLRRWTALPASTDPGPLQGVEGRSYSDLQASPWRMDLGLEQLPGLEKQLQRLKVSQLVEEQAQKQDLQTGQARQQRWKKVPPQLSQIDRLTVDPWQQQELVSR